jgi:hypothetical protein
VALSSARPEGDTLEPVRHVPFGSKADIGARPRHVRFAPKSGHW